MKNAKAFIMGFVACMMLFGGVYAAEQFTAVRIGYDVIVDGEVVQDWGDVPPMNINGRTMLPLAKTGELLGVDVNWDGEKVIVGDIPAPVPTVTPIPTVPTVKPIVNNTTKYEYAGFFESSGLKIEVTKKIPGTYRAHVFRITNISSEPKEYDASKIYCRDYHYLVGGSDYNGIPSLKSGVLQPGESAEGVVFFESEKITTRALFKYDLDRENQLILTD